MLVEMIAGRYTPDEVRVITAVVNRRSDNPPVAPMTIESVTAVLEAAAGIKQAGPSILGCPVFIDSSLEPDRWVMV